ncbi:triacylglycerol lipase [Astrocystis sublimbata]|nr:triacylglycerol lipase [Astrocystis sublimbata]
MVHLYSWQRPLATLALCLQVTGLIEASPTAQDQPTVKVRNGTLGGVYDSKYDQDYFLGVPFAQPPVGQLRFRNPQPLNTTWDDVKPATEYSKECYGYGSDTWVLGNPVSEDCLTLNVVRPHGVEGPLPVGLWIHGGGFFEGGNQDPRYNLSFIVEQSVLSENPFIGISINYRLSAFGMLYGEDLAAEGSSNFLLRDQRLALQWVQENIGAFGGDPEKVTIWGESAGAASVANQLIAYGGRDDKLFRAGIMESGWASGNYPNVSDSEDSYKRLVDATNCSSPATGTSLECLRSVPIDVLSPIINGTLQGVRWNIVNDGDFIQGHSGTDFWLNGDFVKVPVLVGHNRDEGTAFSTRGVDTAEDFVSKVLLPTGVDNATASVLEALYPDIPAIGIPPTLKGRPASPQPGREWKRATAFTGDYSEYAPRRLMQKAFAERDVASYGYVFNVVPAGVPPEVGSTHFQEVAFVFHNTMGLGYDNAVASNPFADVPESYFDVAKIMSRMWVSFIATLDPNQSGATSEVWPKYDADDRHVMIFDTEDPKLAFSKPDTHRAEAIEYIVNLYATVFNKE